MQSRGAKAKVVFAVFFVFAFTVAACNALLDFSSYKVNATDGGPSNSDANLDGTSPNDSDNGDASCIDPTGFGGVGCYKCTPTTSQQLLTACTASKFETFDNAARIKDFDASDPKPALTNGGPPPPTFDGGSSSSSGGPAPPCNFDDPTLPNPILILGASGFPMEQIAKAMGDTATMYYLETGSCLGIGASVLNTPKFDDTTVLSGADQVVYFDKNQDGKETACQIPPGHLMAADIAFSGAFADTCSGADVDDPPRGVNVLPPNTALPTDWKDNVGAVNPIMFAVPATSPEKVISNEAAYRVFGFGSGTSPFAKSVEPWTDENFIFVRSAGAGTQQSIARFLGMPPDALRGVNAGGSVIMRKAFQLSTNVPRTIGINSSEVVDADRTSMRSLAYKHVGQPVAFYPDSDPGGFDRRNIRDGHYPMWIALHVLSRLSATGDPLSASNTELETGGSLVPTHNGVTRAARDAAVKRLVFVLVNREAPPVASVDLFGAYKVLGDVPVCAMRVERAKDGADLTPSTPATSCACAFEAASPGAIPADCKPCTATGGECTADPTHPTCSFGYCE